MLKDLSCVSLSPLHGERDTRVPPSPFHGEGAHTRIFPNLMYHASIIIMVDFRMVDFRNPWFQRPRFQGPWFQGPQNDHTPKSHWTQNGFWFEGATTSPSTDGTTLLPPGSNSNCTAVTQSYTSKYVNAYVSLTMRHEHQGGTTAAPEAVTHVCMR